VFLDLFWKESTKSWRSLTQFEANITHAFRSLRASEESVDVFVKFLATIGSGLVPDVFPLLAEKLGEPDVAISPRALQRLETMLASLVYSGAPRVRNEPAIREAMLRVLDLMIDAGSSKAYRMRDDFVTPLRNRTAKT
jgi:hypothetical protein